MDTQNTRLEKCMDSVDGMDTDDKIDSIFHSDSNLGLSNNGHLDSI